MTSSCECSFSHELQKKKKLFSSFASVDSQYFSELQLGRVPRSFRQFRCFGQCIGFCLKILSWLYGHLCNSSIFFLDFTFIAGYPVVPLIYFQFFHLTWKRARSLILRTSITALKPWHSGGFFFSALKRVLVNFERPAASSIARQWPT
jgi:hypothetical protein